MVTQDNPGPLQGATYRGFATPAPHEAGAETERRRKIALGGVAIALALGLVFGLVARPRLAVHEERPMTAAAQTPNAAGQGQLAIVVDRSPPAAPPKAVGARLEVLPPDLAAAAPRAPAPASFRQAAADTVNDLAGPVFNRAPEEQPIDCSRPIDGREARICRDIGFGPDGDYGSDLQPGYSEE